MWRWSPGRSDVTVPVPSPAPGRPTVRREVDRSMRNVLRRPVGAAGAAATAALLASTLAVTPASAAPNNNNSAKLRAAVTLEGVERHLRALQSIADANGANRYAGLPGYEKSADYVAQQLRAAGYSPTFQTFTYNGFRENSPAQLSQVTPTATTYVNGTDFTIASYSGPGTVTARLVRPDRRPAGLPCHGLHERRRGDARPRAARRPGRLHRDLHLRAQGGERPRRRCRRCPPLQQRPRAARRHAGRRTAGRRPRGRADPGPGRLRCGRRCWPARRRRSASRPTRSAAC